LVTRLPAPHEHCTLLRTIRNKAVFPADPDELRSLMSENRLSPGDVAPDFALPSDDGSTVRLSDLRGRKVIVYFYPAAMTPGCTKQACDFTDSLDSLKGAGYEVLGISPDKPEKLAKFRERDALTITLLSDQDKAVMSEWDAFGEKKMYGKVVQGVIRSTFVVDEDGRIEVAQYNVKATGHVAKLRRELGLAS
jgi:peroxiredoxin Q/BCP